MDQEEYAAPYLPTPPCGRSLMLTIHCPAFAPHYVSAVSRLTLIAAILWQTVCGLPVVRASELPIKPSALFEYAYEGGSPRMVHAGRVNLGAGYYSSESAGSNNALQGATITSDGEHATIDTPQQGGLMLRNPFWETDADHAGGWTWEIRLKVAATNTDRSFQVRIGDGPARTEHAHLGVQFWPDRIQGFNGAQLAEADLSRDFVTLRIAQAPGQDDFLIWLNDRPVQFDAAAERLRDGEATWIGDGSNSAGGMTIVDYIRWTGSGAYAPPPLRERTLRKVDGRSTSQSDRWLKDSPPAKDPNHRTYVSQRRDLPDFGLMLNDDGDVSFPSSDPQTALRYRQAGIDALAGTPVQTLMYSVGMGSDTLYYPTQVASPVGWRKTRYDAFHDQPSSEEQMWAQRLENITNGMSAGVDPIRVSGERAREHGMFFVPSYRMNDDHFMFDPLQYPLTGKFWMEHHERLKIRDSPILSDPHYGQLFDYSHQEVRDFRLAVLEEVIDRYQDLMDGLELDFNRVQVFFPYQKAEERAHLMTDVVAKVRRRLDEAGKRNDRTYYLFVRAPPTLENCKWAGLDIAAWVDRQLVDVLIPAQLMTLAHDMPVDAFVQLAKPHGVQVYPAIYPQTEWMWPMVEQPQSTSYQGAPEIMATGSLFRGAAANYWNMGASGFQLFNFRTTDVPFTDGMYRTMRDLADRGCLRLANKVFAVTPGYYLDYEGTYQYRKQLPLEIQSAQSQTVDLLVGDDLAEAPQPDRLQLRLGFRNASDADQLELRLGDRLLHEGPIGNRLLTAGKAPRQTAPTHYVQLPIDAPSLIQRGPNQLKIRIVRASSAAVGQPLQIVECQLGVFYTRRPNAIFEP
ncbi:hypothetical protein OAS39_03675 [Pirellulales bacterium]|nr:hypothetical protein [Pirellulales bacterium]